ncbi:hypothetical protein B0T10DRAFT_483140 [Thelonectria olida]|uniref:Uncharacterized protein n=1 Tax=Thelonectria olida TaxID=1576542 RepID=A0A9P9AU16_9HYPO|nr:hypothetical protein B0T10DRAFT_483140 [Thelonectria olida]
MARTKNDVAQAESGSPEASKAVVSGKTGRPRGRPRKENKVVKVPSGRPRGRPKGSTKAVAIQKTMESRGASQTEIDAAVAAGTPAKRLSSRRGRPPKAATPSKSKATATPSSAGKRGRGRPKKGPAAPSKEEEPVEENEASAAEDGKH